MRGFPILKDVIQIKGINLFTLSDFIKGGEDKSLSTKK